MKRIKFWGSLMSIAVLLMSIFVIPVGAKSAEDPIRVLIEADNQSKSNLKATHGVRRDFAEKGFTTDVTAGQLQQLQKMNGVSVTLVDKVELIGVEEEAHGKLAGGGGKPGGGTTRALPADPIPWGIEAIYNHLATTSTSGGANIKVAVLDTGVVNHLDLISNLEQCNDFSQNKSNFLPGQCADGNGHGTHVSGTILANGGADGLGIWGVAPQAKLWSYKVLANTGSGYADDIAYAIRYATDQAKSKSVKLIISMSLGSSSKSMLIVDAVNYAVNNGVLVVAAAGNSGPNPDTIGYPGGLSNVIAVASLDPNLSVSDFSSRGNEATAGDFIIAERDVEVSAPGRSVLSTWKDGKYNTISGTSMATPHIAGLAAKIWATSPNLSNEAIRKELQKRAGANDILQGQYADIGDDIASGFGFPLVLASDN